MRRCFSTTCQPIAWVLAMFATVAMGGSATLSLQVGGEILPQPSWLSADDQPIEMIPLVFSGSAVSSDPNQPVESAEAVIRLAYVAQYPAEVAMVRPSGCAIGSTAVEDAHVMLVVNGSASASDGSMVVSSDAPQRLALRFAGEGGYAKLSGQVQCAVAGTLVYSF